LGNGASIDVIPFLLVTLLVAIIGCLLIGTFKAGEGGGGLLPLADNDLY
jgi:hypothetical protein